MIILYLMQKRSSDRYRGSENQSPDDVIIQEILSYKTGIVLLIFSFPERPDQRISTSIGVMCVNAFRLSASSARISTLR